MQFTNVTSVLKEELLRSMTIGIGGRVVRIYGSRLILQNTGLRDVWSCVARYLIIGQKRALREYCVSFMVAEEKWTSSTCDKSSKKN